MSDFSIIENTDEARKQYGYAYGADFFEISKRDIKALNNGKCLAVDINGGEYVAFVTLEEEQKTNAYEQGEADGIRELAEWIGEKLDINVDTILDEYEKHEKEQNDGTR